LGHIGLAAFALLWFSEMGGDVQLCKTGQRRGGFVYVNGAGVQIWRSLGDGMRVGSVQARNTVTKRVALLALRRRKP
jgi:hypothetical protein